MTKSIIVNRMFKDKEIFPIIPASLRRDWMDNTTQKFAYKCLPLNIANQYGWVILSPVDFSVSWYGGSSPSDVEVFSTDTDFLENSITSHFGAGTFTLQLDFIIQTPENYSLYIRGIPNQMNTIITPLDAIVETDWLPFTFTYNYKFSDHGVVDFKKGDPLFVFFPIERGTVENFKLETILLEDNKEFHRDFLEYAQARDKFNYADEKSGFQRFYQNGRGPNKIYSIKNHIKKLIFGTNHDKIED